MGYILDGKLSQKEINEIEKLNTNNKLSINIDDIKNQLKEFVRGKRVKFYHQ